MDPRIFSLLMEHESYKVASLGALLKYPFQSLGSKATMGRFDLADDVIRQQIKDKYKGEPFVKRHIGRYLEGQTVPSRRVTSDENLAVGAGAVGLGVGVAALARKALKARGARKALEGRGLGNRLKDHSLALGAGGGLLAGMAYGRSSTERNDSWQ